jgi:hypothetical protein
MGHRLTARYCSKSCSNRSRTYPTVSLRERFEQFAPAGLASECWPWHGAVTTNGYGVTARARRTGSPTSSGSDRSPMG